MSNPDAAKALADTLAWSKARDYAGHSKHDALNSPFLNTLFGWHKIPRLLAIQGCMRLPFNPRGLLGVPRLRNPKGIGLFAHAWLNLASVECGVSSVESAIPRDECLREADKLLTWLIANASPWAPGSPALHQAFNTTFPTQHPTIHTPHSSSLNTPHSTLHTGLGWGYHYPWQDVGFFQPRHFPNRVVTCWIGMAFLKAFEVTGEEKYRLAARELVDFLLLNPKRLTDTPDELCLSYVPLDRIEWAVMDVSVLVSSVCARLGAIDPPDAERRETIRRLLRFVVDKQTDYGAWFYTHPAKDSHITHDNYHTAIILDAIADTMFYSGEYTAVDAYRAGLRYYRDALFTPAGAPKWMNDKVFPHDIHGAASGILCFRRAAGFWQHQAPQPDPQAAQEAQAMADRIQAWTLQNLYDGQGRFHYQKTRHLTKRFTLMRWCNAWMCRALSA